MWQNIKQIIYTQSKAEKVNIRFDLHFQTYECRYAWAKQDDAAIILFLIKTNDIKSTNEKLLRQTFETGW